MRFALALLGQEEFKDMTGRIILPTLTQTTLTQNDLNPDSDHPNIPALPISW